MNRANVRALENRKRLGMTAHTFARSLWLFLFRVESEFERQMHGSSAGPFTQAGRSGRCIFIQRFLELGVNYQINPVRIQVDVVWRNPPYRPRALLACWQLQCKLRPLV